MSEKGISTYNNALNNITNKKLLVVEKMNKNSNLNNILVKQAAELKIKLDEASKKITLYKNIMESYGISV
jgi:hypothetical protein